MPAKNKSVRAIKSRHERKLLGLDGVVGVGIGTTAAGRDVITVYVAEDSREIRKRVPARLEGVPTQLIESGDIVALDG